MSVDVEGEDDEEKDNESESANRWNNWYNILIFGDCLIVLKFLLENPNVKGKVRLIYIDPPIRNRSKL